MEEILSKTGKRDEEMEELLSKTGKWEEEMEAMSKNNFQLLSFVLRYQEPNKKEIIFLIKAISSINCYYVATLLQKDLNIRIKVIWVHWINQNYFYTLYSTLQNKITAFIGKYLYIKISTNLYNLVKLSL